MKGKVSILLILSIFVLSGFNGDGYRDLNQADQVTVNTDHFGHNLSSTDDNVQHALDTLDDLVGGAVTSVSNSDGTLTISPTSGAITASLALSHANSWTGLQTFSRAGYNSLSLSNAGQIVLNASTNTYGFLSLQTGGVTRAGVSWDSNGGLEYLAGAFFQHRWLIGGTEYLSLNSTGLIINGGGSGPSYALDVHGSVGVSTWSSTGIPFVDNTGAVVTNLNYLNYNSSLNFMGVNQSTTSAGVHSGRLLRTVGDVANFSGSGIPGYNGGSVFSFGTGNKNYSVWGKKTAGGTDIFSVNAATATVSEPFSSDADPTNFSANDYDNGGSSGYDPGSDTPPSYEIIALYDSNNARSIGSISGTTNGGGGWGSGTPYRGVTVNWTVPAFSSYVSGYMIVRNGSDYQIVGSPSFNDVNSGWSPGFPSYPNVGWYVNLTWDAATNATDYILANTTNTSYTTLTGTTSTQDYGAWGGGTPTVTPTSADDFTLISEGPSKLCNTAGIFSIFGATGYAQAASGDELRTRLISWGFYPTGAVMNIDTNGGTLTASGGITAGGSSFGPGNVTFNGGFTSNSTSSINATVTYGSGANFTFETATGSKIGTTTSGKLAFFNATPIIQPGATTDLGVVLSNLGLRAAGTAYPITTSGTLTFTDNNMVLGTTTGTKFGTATSQKLAFYNSTPIVQPAAATDLGTVLSNLGLRVAGTAYGLTTSTSVALTGTTNNVGTITTGTWSGTAIAIAKGGTNATSMTTTGGPVYYNGSSLVTTSGSGTSSQYLSGGGTPTYSNILFSQISSVSVDLTSQVTGNLGLNHGGTGTGAALGSTNGVVYNAGSNLDDTVAGTTGQVLMGNTSSSPSFSSTLPDIGAGQLTITDAKNIVLATTTGTKIGTGTTQKLGFFNATPVVQESGSNDVLASLVTLGLRAASSNPPINLGSGTVTSGNVVSSGTMTSSRATDLGWSVVTGANTACNTTCTNACVVGFDNGIVGVANSTIVACADATADACVCAGAN